jgi:hypothetical protein
MTKILVGYDDGTKKYLGRNEELQEAPKEQLAKAFMKRWNHLKAARIKSEEARWEACAYVKHRVDQYTSGNSPIPEIKLYNATGIDAYDRFVNGFMGNLISSSIRWFNILFEGPNFQNSDEIYGANDYMELILKNVYKEFEESNFYPMDKLASRDCIAQGISAEFIIDDPITGECVYDTLAPWEYWVDMNSRGTVDTIFYRFDLTSDQAKERYGDKTPEKIIGDIKSGKGETLNEFVMGIYPRKGMTNRKGRVLLSTSKAFASVTYCSRDNTIIEESGFDSFPVAVHIWEPNGNSCYGMSPVMRAIDEFKRLNKMSEKELVAIDKTVDPAIAAPMNLKGKLNLDPGSRTYIIGDMKNIPVPIQSTIDMSWTENKIKDQEAKIKSLMFNDLFTYLMQQDKVLTATQASLIKNESLVLLSSVFGSTQYMKINPIIKRTISLMARNNRIPPPPKELMRVKNPLLKISLDGPLARNIKTYTMQDGLNSSMEKMNQLIAMDQLDALDNVDMDEFTRQLMIASGMPQSVLKERADVAEVRKAKAEMQQEQLAINQQQQQSEINRNNAGRSNNNNSQGMN